MRRIKGFLRIISVVLTVGSLGFGLASGVAAEEEGELPNSPIYQKPFLELFMQPKNNLNLPSAVTALLAGELDGGWSVRWRLKLFFFLVRLQRRWQLVEPLNSDPLPEPDTDEPAATVEEAVSQRR